MNARDLSRGVLSWPLLLLRILLYLLLLRWLRDLIDLYRRSRDVKKRGNYLKDVRRGRRPHCSPRCAVIRPDVYKRPDPLIYSQRYLMDQGLAVTWNNPDIQLYENGVPVSSSSLEPDTEYDVVATVYNNSTDAPAVGLPVEYSFQSFGVGAVLTPIGTTTVDLPVKGAPGHPARASVKWRTPDAPGHYCIKVQLVWPDDANPKNNLGQENTNVAAATSPAVFRFPVRNDDTIRKVITMIADAYEIPPPIDCRERPKKEQSDRELKQERYRAVFVPTTEEEADWAFARARHAAASYPIPNGWSVDIEPAEFTLDAGQSQDVTVSITPPEDFRGQRPFNVNAMHGADLLGGVTLTVTKEAPSHG